MLSQGNLSTGPSGPKKLTIKPFKTQPKLPDNFEIDTWNKLKIALHAVNDKVSTSVSKEELYRVSIRLVFSFSCIG